MQLSSPHLCTHARPLTGRPSELGRVHPFSLSVHGSTQKPSLQNLVRNNRLLILSNRGFLVPSRASPSPEPGEQLLLM